MLRSRKFIAPQKKSKETEEGSSDSIVSMDVGWVGPITLRKRAKPDLEGERYRDVSLRLTVHEVKNLSPKGRYFCEVCLDRTLYARTTSKQSDGNVFWGEKFELHNLPEINIITINLYRQGGGSTKERRQRNKDHNQFIAFVTVPLADLPTNSECQQWWTMQSPQINPYLTHLENWHSSPSSRGSDLQSTNPVAHSPSATRFRKRSMPITCFRHSTSTAAFPMSDGSADGSAVELMTNGSKAKRSWTAGAGIFTESTLKGSAGAKSTTVSASASPNYLSFRTSFSLSETPLPQIRLNVLYEAVDVLPLDYYTELRQFLKNSALPLLRYLEPDLSAKQKEELASCLVNIYEKLPEFSVGKFIADLVVEELHRSIDQNMLLRSNSIASKSVECYIKLVGSEYLDHLLRGFIAQILHTDEDFEMDSSRLKASNPNSSSVDVTQIERNCTSLMKHIMLIWRRIADCIEDIPFELREAFCSLRRLVEEAYGPQTAAHVISSCLFLRFICPAIHGPVLFGLTASVPESSRISRNLTLIAKVLQTLANCTTFGEKELHMKPLNTLVEREIPVMRIFLDNISSTPLLDSAVEEPDYEDCHAFIDLGFEFAKLSGLLTKYTQVSPLPEELQRLPDILTVLKEHTSDAVPTSWTPHGIPFPRYTIYDATGATKLNTARPHLNSTDGLSSAAPTGEVSMDRHSSNGSSHSLSSKSNGFVQEPSVLQQNMHLNGLYTDYDPDSEGSASNLNGTIDLIKLGLPPKLLDDATCLNGLPVVENMNKLLTEYREQLRQLNDCIEKVEPPSCGAPEVSSCSNCTLKPFEKAPLIHKVCIPTFYAYEEDIVGEVRKVPSNSAQTSNACRLVNDDYAIQSDYESGDTALEQNDHYCKSEPVDVRPGSNQTGRTSSRTATLSESPSFDQLAERLQELKLLLKQERQELAQVVATKTKALEAQEQSIEELASELDQLRRMPNTRLQSSTSTSASSTKYSPVTISPSSSFASEYCTSMKSDELSTATNSDSRIRMHTSFVRCRHQKSESSVSGRSTQLAQHGVRSHSFLSKIDKYGPESAIPTKYGSNLLDLSRTSEGTGIPLSDLINSKHASPMKRRFSETKILNK